MLGHHVFQLLTIRSRFLEALKVLRKKILDLVYFFLHSLLYNQEIYTGHFWDAEAEDAAVLLIFEVKATQDFEAS